MFFDAAPIKRATPGRTGARRPLGAHGAAAPARQLPAGRGTRQRALRRTDAAAAAGDRLGRHRVGVPLRRPRAEQAHALDVASQLFGPTTIGRSGVAALDRYQAIVRVHGAILGAFVLFALLGLILGAERAADPPAPPRVSLRGAIARPA